MRGGKAAFHWLHMVQGDAEIALRSHDFIVVVPMASAK